MQYKCEQLTSSEHWGLKQFITDINNICNVFHFWTFSMWALSHIWGHSDQPFVTSQTLRGVLHTLMGGKALHQDFFISVDAQRILREDGKWVSLNVGLTCFPCQWKQKYSRERSKDPSVRSRQTLDGSAWSLESRIKLGAQWKAQ